MRGHDSSFRECACQVNEDGNLKFASPSRSTPTKMDLELLE